MKPSPASTPRSPSSGSRSRGRSTPAVDLSRIKYPKLTLLRQHRLSLGLSLRDVAESLEPRTAMSYLHQIETGQSRIGPVMAERLARFYGVTPEWVTAASTKEIDR